MIVFKDDNPLIKKLVTIFVILQVLDIISTYSFLSIGLVEGNPLFHWLFEINLLLGFSLKVVIVMLMVYLINFYVTLNLNLKPLYIGLVIINIGYFFVVSINFLAFYLYGFVL